MKEMVGGCCVCSDEQGLPENPLVYCDGDGCTVAVHQACYGIITVPQGPWFCRRCESQERAAKVKCELCPQRDGALKKTDTNGWAHVVCALYIPEVRFGNVSTMEPIMLGLLPPDRWSKSCYICESKGKESKASVGACMQCNKSTCKNYFHVTCAQAEGLLCEEAGNYHDAVKYCGYCNHHYKKILESSEKVPSKDSKRFTLVTTRKDYPSIKPIPAFRPIPSHVAGLKSPDAEKNKSFNSSLSSSSSSLSSSSSSLSSFKPSAGQSDKHGSRNKSDDKFSRTIASDKSFHDKDRKADEDKSKDKDAPEKDEVSKKRSIKNSKDHHHSSKSKSDKSSKSSGEKDKEKDKTTSSTSSNAASSVTSITTSTNCTGLSSLSTLNDLNPTTRLFDDRPSGQFSLSSFIDPKLASKNQSKKAAEKDPKANNSSSKDKDKSAGKESGKSSSSSTFGSSNGGHSSSKVSNSKSDSTSTKNKDSSSDAKSSTSASKNTHEKHSDGKKGSSTGTKRKVTPDSKSSKSSSNAKKRKRFDTSSSSSSDSEDIIDKSDSDDSDDEDIKSRKTPVSKSKGKTEDTKSTGKNRSKKVVASKTTSKATKKSDSPHVNGTSNSKGKSVNGTKQSPAASASKKKSKIISSDDDDDEDEVDGIKEPSNDDDNSSNGTEPNIDDLEPKPKNKKASSTKDTSSMSATGTGNSKQEKRTNNKSNGYIPSPSPSLTPMTNKNAPTGHNVDMDRVFPQQNSSSAPTASSFAIPPAPTSRQNRSPFPVRDPSEPPPSSLEELLERQWAQGANFILDQAQHYDIASLLSCLSQLRQDNERLEERLRHLTSRREHLLTVNARLALPLNGSFNTSHGSMPTGNSSNASSTLPTSSSPFLPPPAQPPPMGFQQLLNAAAVLQTPGTTVGSHEHSLRTAGSSSRSSFSDTTNSNLTMNGTRYPNDAFNSYLTSSGLPDATGTSPHHSLHANSSSRPSSRSSPFGSGVNSL